MAGCINIDKKFKCYNKHQRRLEGACFVKDVVYQAVILSGNKKFYIGAAKDGGKDRVISIK